MGGQNNMPLPTEVAPGQTIDIVMNFTAPLIEKDYRGNWFIKNEKGELFGTTATAQLYKGLSSLSIDIIFIIHIIRPKYH